MLPVFKKEVEVEVLKALIMSFGQQGTPKLGLYNLAASNSFKQRYNPKTGLIKSKNCHHFVNLAQFE